MKQKSLARLIAMTGMLSAVAAVLMFFEFSVPFFLKMDLSDLPALIAAFSMGPWSGVAVCLVKNLVNLFFSSSGGVGGLINFLLGVALVLPAAVLYRRKGTRASALLGSLLGAIAMAAVSLPLNLYVIYPLYSAFMPMDTILAMYRALNPSVETLWQALLWFNVPFTFIKGLVVALAGYALYRPLEGLLREARKTRKAKV